MSRKAIRMKLTFLVAAVAAMALAVPSMASAEFTWTHNDVLIEGSEEFTQTLRGPMFFDSPIGSFGCEKTVSVTARAGSTATVGEFKSLTDTCAGTGAFVNCAVTNDTFNTPWALHATTGGLVVTNQPSDIELHIFYGPKNGQPCGVGSTTVTQIGQIKLEPTLDSEGTIEGLAFSPGTIDTAGVLSFTGELEFDEPEFPTLGLQ